MNMLENEQLLTIKIKDVISSDLALRDTANEFFNSIESRKNKKIAIDFSEISSISRSFAQQYLTRKQKSKKEIVDINIPPNINKMFELIKNQEKRANFLDRKSIKFICI